MSATITWSEFKDLVDLEIDKYLKSPECDSHGLGQEPKIKIKFMETVTFPAKEDIQIDIYEHSPGLIYVTVL